MTPVASLPAAGRALDALVSETIFGPWDESRCRVCGWPIVSHDAQGCWSDNCSMRPPPGYRADEPHAYSTDIKAAWEVVEKISGMFGREAQFTVKLRTGYDGPQGEWLVGWQVWRDAEGGWEWSDILGTAEGQTAPYAICMLALKAVAP